jgi:glycosyltransferase EpsF
MRRLRVLQVVDSLGVGGAETWLIALVKHWRELPNGPQVEFLTTGQTIGALEGEALAHGAAIHRVQYGKTKLLSFARGFCHVLRHGAYDAVHDHQDYASGWHFLLGARALPPVRVTHVHNPHYQVTENYGGSVSRRLTGRIGVAMIAQFATHIAGTSRQSLHEHGFDSPAFSHIPKLAVHCGFDTTLFARDRARARREVRIEFNWPDNARIALFAGRIDVSPDPGDARNHKNSGLAVAIAIAACGRDPSLRVLFAGPPSVASPVLEDRIAAAGLGDRIRLIGVRRDIARLMRGSDALLFPSRSEGLGMVAVEAQAAGLPVLASTAVPRECVVVKDLVEFLEIEAGVDAWTQALLRLANAPRWGDAANRAVAASGFGIENSAARLAALYKGQLAA